MKINGIHLHVRDEGGQAPFIWAHGLMGSIASEDHVNWFKWDKMLGCCRLIRYDARGHGKSEASQNPEDYLWSKLAYDMIALARLKRLDQFIAGGRSMGCATAIYAALEIPTMINKKVLAIRARNSHISFKAFELFWASLGTPKIPRNIAPTATAMTPEK